MMEVGVALVVVVMFGMQSKERVFEVVEVESSAGRTVTRAA